MSSPRFVSPGALGGNAIEQFLLQRAEEERKNQILQLQAQQQAQQAHIAQQELERRAQQEARIAQTQQAALPGPAPAPEITPTARVRETFAQFVPAEPKKPEAAAPKKRKVAKSSGQPMRFARSGFFGTSTW